MPRRCPLQLQAHHHRRVGADAERIEQLQHCSRQHVADRSIQQLQLQWQCSNRAWQTLRHRRVCAVGLSGIEAAGSSVFCTAALAPGADGEVLDMGPLGLEGCAVATCAEAQDVHSTIDMSTGTRCTLVGPLAMCCAGCEEHSQLRIVRPRPVKDGACWVVGCDLQCAVDAGDELLLLYADRGGAPGCFCWCGRALFDQVMYQQLSHEQDRCAWVRCGGDLVGGQLYQEVGGYAYGRCTLCRVTHYVLP